MGRRQLHRTLLLCALSALGVVLARRALLAGDGLEYYSMLESLFRHATPEQRLADAEHVRAIVGAHGVRVAEPHDGFFVNDAGRWYSYHFWLYPLACVPVKAVLHTLGADEFYALAWTNAALFVIAIGHALRARTGNARAF